MALGAEPVTTTVEGRERYTVSIRYPRDYRSRPEAIASRSADPAADGGTVPLGEVAKVSLAQGPSSIRTEDAQLATLYLCRSARPRSRQLCRRREEGGGGRGRFPARLLRDLERPVRILRARQGAAADRRAGDHAHHLPAALPQFPAHHRDADRHAVGAVRACRRLLADVVARLQPLRRRGRRLHRACRRRRRDRRRHADLSRQRAEGAEGAARERKGDHSPATISTPRSCQARSSACARR